ncbi:bacterial transcriptional activator domain-containing protein [Pigmentibacter sp. JX0631]|uniref:bacterial transcriptional activator domain-containing protein n=1 Tax=Pigmentibacter sp. JX0631 TaxID=2976982 RepID=UPI0024695BA8|nr:bacterial transcriptional activator domain-containing protein [Pigmentibacter sp. JX0631]WGL59025.1 bacterial transcriptional activator domain-containing protein [Pigmentibacter sp. JX0631]
MKQKIIFVTIFCFSVNLVGCSGNILARYSTQKSLQEQAEYDMQNGDYTAAQTKLQTILAGDPLNYTAVSMLAACYAAIGGVILVDILIKSAVQSTSGNNSNSNSITLASSVLPTPTPTVFAQMAIAINTMATIPQTSLTSEMSFQQQMFLDLYLLLQILDLINTLRAGGTLTNAQITLLFNTIGNINSVSGSNNNQVSQAVSNITNGINNSPGANQNQQVANYLTPFI